MEVSGLSWWKAANAAGLEQKLTGGQLPHSRKVLKERDMLDAECGRESSWHARADFSAACSSSSFSFTFLRRLANYSFRAGIETSFLPAVLQEDSS